MGGWRLGIAEGGYARLWPRIGWEFRRSYIFTLSMCIVNVRARPTCLYLLWTDVSCTWYMLDLTISNDGIGVGCGKVGKGGASGTTNQEVGSSVYSEWYECLWLRLRGGGGLYIRRFGNLQPTIHIPACSNHVSTSMGQTCCLGVCSYTYSWLNLAQPCGYKRGPLAFVLKYSGFCHSVHLLRISGWIDQIGRRDGAFVGGIEGCGIPLGRFSQQTWTKTFVCRF